MRMDLKSFFLRNHKALTLFFFIALSILYFGWGLIDHLSTQLIGGSGDSISSLWCFAWWPYAILHKINPLFSSIIWAPTGINLARINTAPGLALLFSPITLIWGAVVSSNIAAFLTPALSAWTAYLLFYYLSQSWRISLIGGYLFGYSSYMIYQVPAHVCLAIPAVLIPIFPLLILKYLDKKIRPLNFILYFYLALVFLYLFEIEVFATFTFWGSVCFCMAFIFFQEKRAALISCSRCILLAFFLSVLSVAPFIYYFFSDNNSSFSEHLPDFFSNDLLSLFLSPPGFLIDFNPIIHSFLARSSDHGKAFFDVNIFSNIYIGIGCMVIFFLFVKEFWHTKAGKYLAVISAVLLLASLGPIVHIIGYKVFTSPLKNLFIKTPLLSAALPVRLGLYVSLAVTTCIVLWARDSTRSNLCKVFLLGVAILFLIPSFDQNKRLISTPIAALTPDFFTTESYKKFLTPQDNVLILPYYYKSFELLWQVKTNFYFKSASGYVGPIPENYFSDPVEPHLLDPAPNDLTKTQLQGYIARHLITKIMLLNQQGYGQWRPLLLSIDPTPVVVGGIELYNVNKIKIKIQKN